MLTHIGLAIRDDHYYYHCELAGHYVPQLAQKVVEYNARKGGQHINLKGVMVRGTGLHKPTHKHTPILMYVCIITSYQLLVLTAGRSGQAAISFASKHFQLLS